MNANTHRGIREAIRARIVAGEWALGELIPAEAEFAAEYGCSRTTVNRALQALANEGIVERKRKGGTRIRPVPLPRAQLKIPLLRLQVEDRGASYRHRVLTRDVATGPRDIRALMRLPAACELAYVETLHLADDAPFAFERRWVDLDTVPDFAAADLEALSANEWLVKQVPFTNGEVSLFASAADRQVAHALQVAEGTGLFTMRRTTWQRDRSITTMTLHYAEDYRLDFAI